MNSYEGYGEAFSSMLRHWQPSDSDMTELNRLRYLHGHSVMRKEEIEGSRGWTLACNEIDEAAENGTKE